METKLFISLAACAVCNPCLTVLLPAPLYAACGTQAAQRQLSWCRAAKQLPPKPVRHQCNGCAAPRAPPLAPRSGSSGRRGGGLVQGEGQLRARAALQTEGGWLHKGNSKKSQRLESTNDGKQMQFGCCTRCGCLGSKQRWRAGPVLKEVGQAASQRPLGGRQQSRGRR